MRLLYILASYLLFALLSPVLAVLNKKTRGGALERIGIYRRGRLPPKKGLRVWMHGASAGDLLSLSPMIPRLRDRFPGCTVILSTITNTGHLMASERLAKQIDGVV